MPTNDRDFQLGLLPEKKWNWRTFAASYGMVSGLVLLLIFFGVLTPETLAHHSNYHVTELVPRPALRPEPLPKPQAAASSCEVAAARNRCFRRRN